MNLKFVGFHWLLWSLIAGIAYWFLNGWLVNQLTTIDALVEIIEWQQSTINYYPLSLFLGSVVLAPIFEELVFRGLVLNAMKQTFNNWIAVGVSALLFALIHWSWPEFISLFIIGSIYGWITVKSNSLLPALVAHITHNALTFWQHVSV